MGIEEPELVELVNQIEKIEQQLFSHPLHKVIISQGLMRCAIIQNVTFLL